MLHFDSVVKLRVSDSSFTVVTWSSSCLYALWARGNGEVGFVLQWGCQNSRNFYEWYANSHSEHCFCSGNGRAAVVENRLPTSPNFTHPQPPPHTELRETLVPSISECRTCKTTEWRKWCSDSNATKPQVHVYDWCSSDTGMENSAPWRFLNHITYKESNTVNRKVTPTACGCNSGYKSCSILFTDKSQFTQGGITNTDISHSWTQNVMWWVRQ
jgi:hypothetical protein